MFNRINLELPLSRTKNHYFSFGNILCAILFLGLFVALVLVLFSQPQHSAGLSQYSAAQLEQSGVKNPVTAVLLNFRIYDTLLEIAVLLIVAIAALPIPSKTLSGQNSNDLADPSIENQFIKVIPNRQTDPVLLSLQFWLIPMAIVIGGYLLWTGASYPGGAFQAGALLAGAGVLLMKNQALEFNFSVFSSRLVLVIGLLFFCIAAVGTYFESGIILTFSPSSAGFVILVIECAATASITLTLWVLYHSLMNIRSR